MAGSTSELLQARNSALIGKMRVDMPPPSTLPRAISGLSEFVGEQASAPLSTPGNVGVLMSDDEDDEVANQLRADEMIHSQQVLRTGWLWKKGGRTLRMWKRRWFVLRRDSLTYYQDNQEIEARKVVLVDDLSGVTYREISHKPTVCFYHGPKEIHLQARSADDAREWVKALKTAAYGAESMQQSPVEARLPPPLSSPTRPNFASERRPSSAVIAATRSRNHSIASATAGLPSPGGLMSSSLPEEDYMSPNDFSDNEQGLGTSTDPVESELAPALASSSLTQASFTLGTDTDGQDKVIVQGWLRRRHQRTGRWSKRVWAVVRPYGLYLYPERDEYQALLVLSFKREIIDVSELEPQTLGKGRHSQFCFQVITKQHRALRFSCETESELDRWLGGLKSRITHEL
ncbi:hypothetical protein PYCC9005_004813 [Savitreella phatthalungensis]